MPQNSVIKLDVICPINTRTGFLQKSVGWSTALYYSGHTSQLLIMWQ